MSDESKYYTPTIEEFHVGFEYEVQDLHDNLAEYTWRKQVFEGEETRTWFSEELAAGEIRIKYLDKDDIEALGWANSPHVYFPEIYSIKIPENYNNYWQLRQGEIKPQFISMNWKGYNQPTLISMRFEGGEGNSRYDHLFRGNLKNKSELSRLMKQLGIV